MVRASGSTALNSFMPRPGEAPGRASSNAAEGDPSKRKQGSQFGFSSHINSEQKERNTQLSKHRSEPSHKTEVKNKFSSSQDDSSTPNSVSNPVPGSKFERDVSQQSLEANPNEKQGKQAEVSTSESSVMKPTEQRENVQVDFLLSMQKDLGVKPQEVVIAFSQLSEEELAAPPEKTVNKVIEGLGLKGETAEKARGLFFGMLAQTATLDLATDVSGQGNKLSLEVMTQRELNQRNLDSSIENLSSDFFGAVAPIPVSEMSHQIQAPKTQNINSRKIAANNAYQNSLSMAKQNNQMQPQNVAQLGTNSEAALAAEAMVGASVLAGEASVQPQTLNALDNSSRSLLGTSSANPAGGAKIDLSSLGSELLQDVNELSEAVHSAVEASSKDSLAGKAATGLGGETSQMASTLGAGLALASVSSESSRGSNGLETIQDANLGEEFEAVDTQVEAIAPGDMSSENEGSPEEGQLRDFGEVQVNSHEGQMKGAGKSQFVIKSPTATHSDQSANVNEVVNQARYMIKEGGGEMKIRLAPDGLGEMNLKVAMQDGKINVEMITSNSDVKKMMEKGMGDLKSTLAAMKIDVDDVKVEIAKETSTELDQKNQDESKGFEQKFLSDFNRQNRNFRQGFFTGGSDSFGSQTGERAEDAHRIVLNEKSVSGRKSESGRLNVVA